MGDPRRFEVFADYVARQWPQRERRIADVAGGEGGLAAALRRRGYGHVLTIDRRRRLAHPGRAAIYRFGLWDVDEEGDFDLVLGLHPDGATEAIVEWATRRHVPFAVVPCCTINAGRRLDYAAWIAHLERRAGPHHVVDILPIHGRSLVIRGG